MTDINGTYSCCNSTNIFGEETEGEGGGGLTPGQEQDLTDVVEKTQNQDATAGNTNFSGVLTLNGLPISNIPPTDLTDLENKTQNISDLTVANNTKYSGAQNFYMGALGSADVFSINYGVPSDTIVSRIFDTIGGTVNTTATLNTTNIIPSVADT